MAAAAGVEAAVADAEGGADGQGPAALAAAAAEFALVGEKELVDLFAEFQLLIHAGVFHADAAQELVAERAAAALDRLGNDYAMQLGVYGGAHRRAYAKILPITSEAAKENAANNTMLKALK